MQKQISDYIGKFFSPFSCGYRKGFITQYALLMDLPKAFDVINHELRIAKLHVYDFSTDTLEVLLSYLRDRWQRVKIDTTFSSWTQLIQEVPQGSVLGPMLFSIYIYDIFFALQGIDIGDFADDELH